MVEETIEEKYVNSDVKYLVIYGVRTGVLIIGFFLFSLFGTLGC